MYSTVDNIKESFKLAWNHKLLWIVAVLAVGGMNFGGSSGLGGDKDENSDKNKNEIRQDVRFNYIDDTQPVKINEKVLGAATNALNSGSVGTMVGEEIYPIDSGGLISAVPGIIALVFIFSLLVIFNAVISLLISSWARGAFYPNVLKAHKQENYNFKSLGDAGKKYWKRYIKFILYIFLKRFLSFLPFVGIGIVSGVAAFFVPDFVFIPLLLMIPVFVWFVAYNIALGFVEEFSLRILVSDDIDTKSCYKKGWEYLKTRPGKSIKLALAWILAIGLLFAVFFGVAGTITYLIYQLIQKQALVFVGLLLGFLIFVVFMAVFVVATPLIVTAGAFAWTRLYLFTRETLEPPTDVAKEVLDSMYRTEATNV